MTHCIYLYVSWKCVCYQIGSLRSVFACFTFISLFTLYSGVLFYQSERERERKRKKRSDGSRNVAVIINRIPNQCEFDTVFFFLFRFAFLSVHIKTTKFSCVLWLCYVLSRTACIVCCLLEIGMFSSAAISIRANSYLKLIRVTRFRNNFLWFFSLQILWWFPTNFIEMMSNYWFVE